MNYSDSWQGAVDALTRDKSGSLLTSLGIATGTASLVLVVCIVMGGRQFVVSKIQGIGANMIIAEHPGGGYLDGSSADELSLEDIAAVRRLRPQVVASSPMYQIPISITGPGGQDRYMRILGVSPDYSRIRNLDLILGRFFDESEVNERTKAALITPLLAEKLYGSVYAAIGKNLNLQNLSFEVIGVFRERVETFGESEVTKETTLIPYTIAMHWNSKMEQAFFSVNEADYVVTESAAIISVIESRHRLGAVYKSENLTRLLRVAMNAGDALLIVMGLISAITLFIGGVGVMNIMLANAHSRVREIGIRRALGARRSDIVIQFLTEAFVVSLFGGTLGTVAGLAVPFVIRISSDFRVPISGWSVVVSLGSAVAVGIISGTWPARLAAKTNIVHALHFE